MSPDKEILGYLRRWKALREDGEMGGVKKMIATLRIVGIAAAIGGGLGFYFHVHPLFIALAGTVFGYAMAENAALQSRIRTWTRMREYLDWERIECTLKSEHADGDG